MIKKKFEAEVRLDLPEKRDNEILEMVELSIMEGAQHISISFFEEEQRKGLPKEAQEGDVVITFVESEGESHWYGYGVYSLSRYVFKNGEWVEDMFVTSMGNYETL